MDEQRMSRSLVLLAMVLSMPVSAFDAERVAVTVFGEGPMGERLARSAATRIEQVLTDNGVEVLDQAEAEQLKDVWAQLEDPGYFVTAEDFVDNAGAYALDGLVRVYLSVDSAPGLAGYFSATAAADVRLVDAQARVEAHTSAPMGAPGRPPSDGLTEGAAMVNAMQRAVDDSLMQLGLEVWDPTSPRTLPIELGPGTEGARASFGLRAGRDQPALASMAALEDQTWRTEEVSCSEADPSGSYGVVGGYIRDTDHRRRPPRLYGARVHVIDLESRSDFLQLEISPVEMSTGEERGTKRIHDCMFLGSWRYAVAVNGNRIHLFDLERGLELSRQPLPENLDEARLDHVQRDGTDYVYVEGDEGPFYFEIRRPQRGG